MPSSHCPQLSHECTFSVPVNAFWRWKISSWSWRTNMFRSHLLWACHNRRNENAVVGEFQDFFATWNTICFFVCLFLHNGGWHCVFVWQLAAPSLLSTPPFSAMLQSAKLLSVSLERHMLSIFPLTLAFVTASLTHKHTHVRRHSAHISLDMDLLDVKQKPLRSILCKASVGPIDAFTCTFTLDGNYTPTQAQIYIRSCMNALESSHKHRCFSYK